MTTVVERDRWDRPLIAQRKGDKKLPYQRVTTFVKALEDTWGLDLWRRRQVAIGLAMRPDLMAMVSTHTTEKKTLDRLCEHAMAAAASSAGANLGTALHALTEQVDRGSTPLIVMAELRPDLEAYRAALLSHEIEILPDWIEAFVVLDNWKIGGTADRFVRWRGEVVVADLKTGATPLKYGAGSIAMQLACYAHGTPYDAATNTRMPSPITDRDRGLVVHLAAGSGVCTIHELDLAAGKEACEIALKTHAWRKRKDLHRLVVPAGGAVAPFFRPAAPERTADAVALERIAWCRARITAMGDETRTWLAAHWPQLLPRVKDCEQTPDIVTVQIVEQIVALIAVAEDRFLEPFPASRDPAIAPTSVTSAAAHVRGEPDEGAELSAQFAASIRAEVTTISTAAQDAISCIFRQAALAGVSISTSERPTERRCTLLRSLLLLTHFVNPEDLDSLVRSAAELVIGEQQQTLTTGALLGTLGLAEAEAFAGIAHGLRDSTIYHLTFSNDRACVVALPPTNQPTNRKQPLTWD